jgi:UDP-2,4-diacetamido-2,4,6-trideoxy-beta-L-altropyranose hydrolase
MSGLGLLIRADGDSKIGFGHVMRCLALAQYWRTQQGPVTFACHSLAKPVARRLQVESFPMKWIAAPIGSAADAAELHRLGTEAGIAAVVLDGYDFGSDYQLRLAGGEFTRVVLDDYAHLDHYHADLIVNQNAGVDPQLYRQRLTNGDVLLGPRFALLRQELLASHETGTRDQTGTHDQVGTLENTGKLDTTGHGIRLLVTLGGFDVGPLTQSLIDALEMLSSTYGLHVKLLSPLPGLQIRDPRIDLVPFADNMAELYAWADMAVCAGGSTNWEMSYFGIPRLVIVLAENQRGIAEALQRTGCCLNAGWFESLTTVGLRNAMAALIHMDLTAMRAANRTLVDGRGAERVVRRILAVDVH